MLWMLFIGYLTVGLVLIQGMMDPIEILRQSWGYHFAFVPLSDVLSVGRKRDHLATSPDVRPKHTCASHLLLRLIGRVPVGRLAGIVIMVILF